MLRRGSYVGPAGEPLIVVEETGGIIEEDEGEAACESQHDSPTVPDSPSLNPYLLSPYRDLRKRSLPTPQCTSGITASQVRRLSEQGGEGGKGPSPMEAAFLATLSSAPAPSPGGRRHSVVTISRVPQTSLLFGRNRRESIAAFPSTGLPLGLGRFPRKDSSSSLARSPSISGSSFNLQLDIMDDIADIKARKVKLKMWQTDDQEKVCEVQPLDGGSTSRYHLKESRRFSDVSGLPLPPQAKRRASELPRVPKSDTPPGDKVAAGIVCTNTDLKGMLTSLTSSAQEINTQPKQSTELSLSKPNVLDEKRNRLKNNRSNSFDVSLLPEGKPTESKDKPQPMPGNWFTRRHLPMANKKYLDKATADEKEKLLWDKPSGSVVDPKVIGSAIEDFLVKRTSDTPTPDPATVGKKSSPKSWFGGGSASGSEPKESDEEITCDNSICSTLKDLFVK